MESIESRKLRGGYYTPKRIADFISSWAIRNVSDSVLEPSCGDGIFIESIIQRLLAMGANKVDIAKQVRGVEYDPVEADKARRRLSALDIRPLPNQILDGDFFKFCRANLNDNMRYDCVLGNPPFIRYQDFPEEQRQTAFTLMIRAGLKPNRLTNTWIPFLVTSTLLLKNNGRIGMVIPAELFQVNYAAATRKFLSTAYSTLLIITFRRLVFPDVQQEVVLLLGEKNGREKHGIRIIEIDRMEDLHKIDLDTSKKSTVQLDHSSEKWTQYYLSDKEIETLRKIRSDTSIPLSGEFLAVDVGIVTGQNRFFVVPKETIEEYDLANFSMRIIAKASHIKGLIATDSDWNSLASTNNPVFLVNIPDVSFNSLPIGARRYLEYGAKNGYNVGYKCRIRKKWWVLPSVWIPDAFMLRQVHVCPKLVINNCSATATDTLHRVRLTNGLMRQTLSCAFLNSLTLAFSEVIGRSYGGGVLTFEPSEAERLPLPIKNASGLDAKEIDALLRSNRISDVLDITDDVLLRKGLLLPEKDISNLRSIWTKLRDRRMERRSISTKQ